MAHPANEQVLLKPLTVADASEFYRLYALAAEQPFEYQESPDHFTRRIISLCRIIWTIRPREQPHLIVGNCALHHYDPVEGDVQIGGSLLPAYQGKGLMSAAFELAMRHAATHLNVRSVTGVTHPDNAAAMRLVSKLGFTLIETGDDRVSFRKWL